MKIISQNLQTKILLNKKIINPALKRLEKIKFFKDYCFYLSLVNDAQIKKLNKKYHKINTPTDVLSFDISQPINFSTFATDRGAKGDVIISLETAKRNSLTYKVTLEKETLLYIIHGLLHLVGFDDTTKSKAKIMQAKQEEILKKILN